MSAEDTMKANRNEGTRGAARTRSWICGAVIQGLILAAALAVAVTKMIGRPAEGTVFRYEEF